MTIVPSTSFDNLPSYLTLTLNATKNDEMNSYAIQYPATSVTYSINDFSYSDKVRTIDELYTIHACGFFSINGLRNDWTPLESNKMSPISLKDVSQLNVDLAQRIAQKDIEWIYALDISFVEGLTDWHSLALLDSNGEYRDNADGCYAFKGSICSFNCEENAYIVEQWIPSNKYATPAHVEALNDNIFMPPFTEDKNAYGFSWDNVPALNTLEEGDYTFIVVKYKQSSSSTTPGFGFALI